MKHLIYIFTFLFTSFMFAQGGPKVDVVKFRGEVTTTVRNTFDVPTGETWLIWNATTSQLEIAGSDDVWETVGDGIQEGVNDISTSGISLNQGITNTVQVLPDFLGNPSVRIIGGNSDDATYMVISDDKVNVSFNSSGQEYNFNPLGETDSDDLTTKGYVDGLVADGTETIVTAGTNTTVTGNGSSGSPYVINSTASGTGDVTASATFGTDNALIKSDGTGKGVQATGITIDDADNASGFGQLSVTEHVVTKAIGFFGTTAYAGEGYVSWNTSEHKLQAYADGSYEYPLWESEFVASGLPIVDSGGLITATDVEGALAENRGLIADNIGNIAGLDASKLETVSPTDLVDGDYGDFTVSTGVATIDDDAITSAKILNRTITSSKVALNSLGSDVLAAAAVGKSELQPDVVDFAALDDGLNSPTADYILKVSADGTEIDYLDPSTLSGGSGVTTEQANRIANANLSPKDSLLTSAVDSLYADYSHFQSGTDIGRKKRLRKNNGRLDLFPTSETIPVNKVWRLRTMATNDTIAINPLNGYTIIADGMTSNAAYITGIYGEAYLEKTASDTLLLSSPSFTEFTYATGPTELYTRGDAADANNETATVDASYVGSSIETLEASTDDASDGTRSIKIEDAAGGTQYGVVTYTQTGFTAGSLTYSLDARQSVGTTGQIEVRDGTGGTVLATHLTADNSATFETFSGTVTLTGTTLEIRYYPHYGDTLANTLYVDNVSFTQ